MTRGLEVSRLRQLEWSVRRELWENRAIYLAPVLAGALALAGFAVALVMLPARLRGAQSLGGRVLHELVEEPYLFAALALMAVEMIIAAFYCLDALYGERRDRSILFWKSLPVSDATTVLAKACIPVVLLPLVTAMATTVVQGVMLLASTLVLSGGGISVPDWHPAARWIEIAGINFRHLVVFHGLWYAPLYAWLLLVSAWAPRLPFLWAVLPPVALAIVERVAFNSRHFVGVLQTYFLGGPPAGPRATGLSMDMLAPHPLGHLLSSPALWLGLCVAGVFLLGAIRLRHYKGAM